jgi:hypothetical protein
MRNSPLSEATSEMQLKDVRLVFSRAPACLNKIVNRDGIVVCGPSAYWDRCCRGGFCCGMVDTTKRQAPIDGLEVAYKVGHSD